MAANIITLVRIFLSFLAIGMFYGGFGWRIAAVLLTILVIYLDSLDGIVARKLGVASDFGALFDITGDRIVEHVYWIFFSVVGLVSLWVPIIYVSRGFLVDTLRTVAYSKEGKTPFGEKSMMRSRWTHLLTASRVSRAIYGAGKVIVFVLLGILLIFERASANVLSLLPANFLSYLELITQILVWIVVVMNLIRGLPVLWDGRFYLFDKQFPRELKDAN
jgi:CDP-diacylglycerol--glycerol-3-phosphate 3-phosphatidyltransferase